MSNINIAVKKLLHADAFMNTDTKLAKAYLDKLNSFYTEEKENEELSDEEDAEGDEGEEGEEAEEESSDSSAEEDSK